MSEEHDALSCPECRAASEACRVVGGVAEAMEKALAAGVFERLGAEAALAREKAILDAVFPQPRAARG